MITIIIGGDVCPTSADIGLFVAGDAEGIFHDLIDDMRQADLSLVNLECPLTDVELPITKCGPNLRAPVAAMNAIRRSGIDVLNLANNHILDHGGTGLASTLQVAENAGIGTVGAGQHRDEARRILIYPTKGVRIGILGVAEHEFSIATNTSPGANPLDLIDVTRNIAEQRGNFDYLIVLLHGGNEHYPYPSPKLMDTCRFLVEQGANTVVCQHSHCVGCCEEYRGGHIVYGQGNLVFHNGTPTSGWNEGVLVYLHLLDDGSSHMELAPFEQSRNEPGARRLPPVAAQVLLEAMNKRSANIQVPGFVECQWQRFCNEKRHLYLSMALGHGRVFRRLNRRGHLFRLIYSAKSRSTMENMIRCDAHRNVLETIFDQMR